MAMYWRSALSGTGALRMPRSGGRYAIPNSKTTYATARIRSACPNGCRRIVFTTASSSLIRQESDDRLELRGGELLSVRPRHRSGEGLVACGHLRVRLQDRAADVVRIDPGADPVERRSDRSALAAELVAGEAL